MKRTIILLLMLAALVALFVGADLESMSSAILTMPGEMFLALVMLLIGSEVLKGLRWAFLLRAARLQIRVRDAVMSYLAAQAASALPGGSVLSARLAQEHGHVRMHQAASGLVGETVADMWALSLLASAAILITQQAPAQLVAPSFVFLIGWVIVFGVRSPRLRHWGMSLLGRWRLTRRFLPEEADFLHHSATLMRGRTLAIAAGLSVTVTILSALILLILTTTLTVRGMTIGEALYVHSLSVATRMVIPVPGGYGVGDAGLAGMLNYIGIGLARATFIAISYRSVGILFRTFFGLLFLITRYPQVLIGPLDVPRHQPVGARRWAPRPLVRQLSLAVLMRTAVMQVEPASSEMPEPPVSPGR